MMQAGRWVKLYR